MQSAASLAKHMAGIVGITYENEELLAYVNFLNTMIMRRILFMVPEFILHRISMTPNSVL